MNIKERLILVLQAKKALDFKLGNPENLTPEARKKGREKRTENAIKHSVQVARVIKNERSKGLSYRKLASKLNSMGYKTRRGKQFGVSQIQMIEQRIKANKYSNYGL